MHGAPEPERRIARNAILHGFCVIRCKKNKRRIGRNPRRVKKVRHKFVKSIPGAMKTMNLIFKILEKHTRDSKYSDFGSIWMVLGIDGGAFCIGFDMDFIKKLVC